MTYVVASRGDAYLAHDEDGPYWSAYLPDATSYASLDAAAVAAEAHGARILDVTDWPTRPQ